MGSNQSTPSDTEKAALQRLRALQLENKQDIEDDYEYISSEKTKSQDVQALVGSRRPETVPVSLAADWQDALLKDSKNR